MKIAHTIRNILHSTRFQELMRFGIVGVTATLIQYGIYYLCNAVIAMGATTSLTIGYIISFVFNFFSSNYFTFKTQPTVKKGLGFVASHCINYVLQIVFLHLYMLIGIPETWAPIPMFATVVPINFLLVRFVLKSPKL